MPMETRGWANMVPPAIRATASSFNLVYILYSLLPRKRALDGPIAKALKMLCFRPLAAQGGWWRRTAAVVFSRCARVIPAGACGLSDRDGVFQARLPELGHISRAGDPAFRAR